jgi:hypothetical protein
MHIQIIPLAFCKVTLKSVEVLREQTGKQRTTRQNRWIVYKKNGFVAG